jgi:sodium-dependent dicarboxylate transporter 2/3/5
LTSRALRRAGHHGADVAAIYGENIGGLGSLVGSPSNLLLVGRARLLKVRDGKATFASWFSRSCAGGGFAMPGWLVAAWLAAPRTMRSCA